MPWHALPLEIQQLIFAAAAEIDVYCDLFPTVNARRLYDRQRMLASWRTVCRSWVVGCFTRSFPTLDVVAVDLSFLCAASGID